MTPVNGEPEGDDGQAGEQPDEDGEDEEEALAGAGGWLLDHRLAGGATKPQNSTEINGE